MNRMILDDALEEVGWQYFIEPQADDRDFIIMIRLYCARWNAISEAQKRLSNFSKNQVPISYDELRLETSTVNNRRIFSAKTAQGTFPKNILHWQSFVLRAEGRDERRQIETHRAHQKFVSSKLPGKAYNPDEMTVHTESEPINVQPTIRENWIFVSLIVPVLALIITAALPSLRYECKVMTMVAAMFIASYMALSLTEDSPQRDLRTTPILVSSGLVLFIWAVFNFTALPNLEPRSIHDFWQIVLLFILLAFGLSGWSHLVILHPKVKILGSISILTLFSAAAIAITGTMVSAAEGALELPLDSVAIPAWMQFVITLWVIRAPLVSILLLGAVAGWSSYCGFYSVHPLGKMLAYLIIFVVSVMYLIVSMQQITKDTVSTLETWEETLIQGNSPELTGDFLYRACIIPEEKRDSGEPSLLGEPLVVIQGKDDKFWSWNLVAEDMTPVTTPLDVERHEIHKLKDNETRCALDRPTFTERILSRGKEATP